jgi:hypothetical protein
MAAHPRPHFAAARKQVEIAMCCLVQSGRSPVLIFHSSKKSGAADNMGDEAGKIAITSLPARAHSQSRAAGSGPRGRRHIDKLGAAFGRRQRFALRMAQPLGNPMYSPLRILEVGHGNGPLQVWPVADGPLHQVLKTLFQVGGKLVILCLVAHFSPRLLFVCRTILL